MNFCCITVTKINMQYGLGQRGSDLETVTIHSVSPRYSNGPLFVHFKFICKLTSIVGWLGAGQAPVVGPYRFRNKVRVSVTFPVTLSDNNSRL